MSYWSDALERSWNFLTAFFSPGVIVGLCCAFIIAGAINVFIPKPFIMKYLGDSSNKFLAYSVAIIAGIVISV